MIDFLSKTAGILNQVDSPAAKQASAAIDGVLRAHAARRSNVMTPEEVSEFNSKLKDFLDATLTSGKIPRGLKWRLLQLKDGHVQLTRQLSRLEKQQARGEMPLVPAELPGETTPVEMPEEAAAAEKSWAEIVEDAERERVNSRPAPKDVPAPVELPPLTRKPIEVSEPQASEVPVATPTDISPELMRKQAPVKVLSPEEVSELTEPSAKPKLPTTETSEDKRKPQGTHAETWDEKLRRWMGVGSRAELLSDMIKVANKLDEEGFAEAADIVEKIVVSAAADGVPALNESRKDLYDFSAHNQETMHEAVKQEVEENRKNHHLQTHQGIAVSQTRYSPDLPGVMMKRISDGLYQDVVTHKTYDFQNGFTDARGEHRAGGSIKHQTPSFSQYAPPSRIFEGLSRRK